ncbi:MAG: hypothetical protein OXE99_06045 [Cellvibrionales bacterium]|nr:hypothetical protein [Cellvibrionales bacterium]
MKVPFYLFLVFFKFYVCFFHIHSHAYWFREEDGYLVIEPDDNPTHNPASASLSLSISSSLPLLLQSKIKKPLLTHKDLHRMIDKDLAKIDKNLAELREKKKKKKNKAHEPDVKETYHFPAHEADLTLNKDSLPPDEEHLKNRLTEMTSTPINRMNYILNITRFILKFFPNR